MIERETTDQSQDWNAECIVDDQKHHFESGRSSLILGSKKALKERIERFRRRRDESTEKEKAEVQKQGKKRKDDFV